MAVDTRGRQTVPMAGRSGPAGRPGRLDPARLSWLLLALLVAAVAAAPFLPTAIRDPMNLTVSGLGIVALVAGIRWHRPEPALPWWLLAAGAASGFAAVITVIRGSGETQGGYEVPSPPAIVLFNISAVLSIIGFSAIGRRGRGRSVGTDLIDATMVAAALFPLLWAIVIHPVLESGRFPVAPTVTIPIVVVLTVVAVAKLLFSVGGRNWSAWALFAAAAAMTATSLAVLLPAVLGETDTVSTAVERTWLIYPTSLGIAGLHPAMLAATAPPPRPDVALSLKRLVLLALLALLVPVGTAVHAATFPGLLHGPGDAAGLLLPVVVVAVLLVVRLTMIARLAQRRAGELARQAQALDTAAREQEVLRQQLTYRALHDPLTGLSNRAVLSERLEWALTRRTGTGQHALLLLDLDGFKDVNDTLGHQVGDELLIAAAHRVLALLPEDGMLARLGGDEFAALLEETGPDAATAWAERVLRSMRRPFDLAGRQLYLTTSVGIAVLEAGDGQATPSHGLRDADLALYAAKGAGKDRALLFEPAMREARLNHSRLSAGLRQALANDEFTVEYQPVVDLVTGQVRAVEALLRWTTSTGARVPPAEFIPIAEETGIIREIGEWVLRQACARARPWYTDRGVAVSVNVSGRQLVDRTFAETVLDALASTGLPGRALILEVTETSMIATATVDVAARQLTRLRSEGIRVAIDDFGTGYSSLSYLSRLPVDILKIDSSFTRDGGGPESGPTDWRFAKAIMELGQGLRLTTVAEGIETSEQADALRRLRCQLAQGYLFSRPVPPESIDRLLARS